MDGASVPLERLRGQVLERVASYNPATIDRVTSKIMAGYGWLVKANLVMQVAVTLVALAWGTFYTTLVRRADPEGHEVFKVQAINDFWFGTQSGVAIMLASQWTKTIIIMIVFMIANRVTPTMVTAMVYQALKQ